jgi:hypothetical protein
MHDAPAELERATGATEGVQALEGWGRRQYIQKQETEEYGVRGDEEREEEENEGRWRRNAPITRSQASNSQMLRCERGRV